MKKLLVIATALVTLISCEKGDLFEKNKKDKPCAVVSPETIPSAVASSFQNKYAGAAVEKWFNKDNAGYVTLFTWNGKKTLSEFSNDGAFLKEETEADHQDGNDDNDSGCECEIDE
ncbi:MAG: hypothetical protein JWO44_214 [Bacteroidetes bacterium]|nr:hypothetical protein [Bacteroidota bacterium]